jgi:TIR domain
LIPPILEVFVLWHPDDPAGKRVADALLEHFHGTAFSGLVGGAVEVYTRSAAWDGQGGPPRPVPFMEALPNGLQPAAVTVVVPVLGVQLARAAQHDERWLRYLEEMVASAQASPNAEVFSLVADSEAMSPGGQLARLFASRQSLDKAGVTDRSVLCRDLGHSIAGFVDGQPDRQLRVFVSHTKRYSPAEVADEVSRLVGHVRTAIGDTHLLAFFDEADLQPGMTWQDELIAAAESSALLVVRTDLYASREWCQKEVLAAKRADMPVVVLQALHTGEERGCFLMDHVPSVAVRTPESPENQPASIDDALNKLVDEALKRSLWRQQRERLAAYGFDWLPANAPEPATLAHWLRTSHMPWPAKDKLFVMHPDPPLGTAELAAIDDLVAIAAAGPLDIEILTPRTFASRGGQTPQ